MNYSIPLELKIFSESVYELKDFLKQIQLKSNTMVFLSEKLYGLLKSNSDCIEQADTKVFRQQDSNKNIKAYIETINIDSSNCSFLKSISSDDFKYEYSNGIPKKILIIAVENEQSDFGCDISVSVIESDKTESPVNCIINTPDIFEDSIVFLNSNSYERLKRNTNRISYICGLERLTWDCDCNYPGGEILLNCLNYGSLYLICNMSFPFFKKNFGFNQAPNAIYFIS